MAHSTEPPMSREAAIGLIKIALDDAHEAIRAHPAKTVDFFERANALHETGMNGAAESEWSRSVGLSLPELAIIHRYLFSMSFISAYWDVHADLPPRDKAAQSASLLVAAAGLDPEDVMRRLLKYEAAWKAGIRTEHI